MIKYKFFTSQTFDKFIEKRYIMQNARKQHSIDEYVQIILCYNKVCSIIDDAIVTFA